MRAQMEELEADPEERQEEAAAVWWRRRGVWGRLVPAVISAGLFLSGIVLAIWRHNTVRAPPPQLHGAWPCDSVCLGVLVLQLPRFATALVSLCLVQAGSRIAEAIM